MTQDYKLAYSAEFRQQMVELRRYPKQLSWELAATPLRFKAGV